MTNPWTTLQKVICNFDILLVIRDASQQQNSLFISYTELYNAIVTFHSRPCIVTFCSRQHSVVAICIIAIGTPLDLYFGQHADISN